MSLLKLLISLMHPNRSVNSLQFTKVFIQVRSAEAVLLYWIISPSLWSFRLSGSKSGFPCGSSPIRSWSFLQTVAWLSQWSTLCPFTRWRNRVSFYCSTTSDKNTATTLQRNSLLLSATLFRAVLATVSSAICCRSRTGERDHGW